MVRQIPKALSSDGSLSHHVWVLVQSKINEFDLLSWHLKKKIDVMTMLFVENSGYYHESFPFG